MNNLPIIYRFFHGIYRWNQITDNLPTRCRNLPMTKRPIIDRPICGIDRSADAFAPPNWQGIRKLIPQGVPAIVEC